MKVNWNQIYPATLFGDIPILCRKYKFAHVIPAMGEWEKNAIDYCNDILSNEPRVLIKAVKPIDPNGIETCEIFLQGSKAFTEQLISFGFAKFE